MQQVTVRVPASTSNLGPGFDCLGVALRLYNEVTVRRNVPARHLGIVRETARAFFSATKSPPFDFSTTISGEVPVARGLGSSATIRVGLLLALNKLAGADLNRQKTFVLAAKLEQHPDNAAPATFGGFTLTRGQRMQRFPVAERLHFVLLIPELEIATKKARAVLPKTIARTDAIRSAGNTAAIAAAFASRAYENLRGNFWDGLHQPYRQKLIPHLDDCITAAEDAGALGAFLSGSGSAISAVTLRSPGKIARAMQAACPLESRTIVTHADNNGARIAGLRRR